MAYTTKGECRNTGKTHFKKGYTPWNKGKKLVENTKQRRQKQYRRLILEISDKPYCNRCKEREAKLVHHINNDKYDDRIENLEPLCYSCHAREHKIHENFKYVGYEAVKIAKLRKENKEV